MAIEEEKVFQEKFILEAAERVAKKLNKLIEDGHDSTAFFIAIVLAAAKDSMDLGLNLALVGMFPILGQLPGLFISAVLMYFLWGKGWFNKIKIKVIWWIFGLFFDNLPLLNSMPITVFTVLMAWHVVRKKAEKAEEDLEKLSERTMEELEEIEKETGIK